MPHLTEHVISPNNWPPFVTFSFKCTGHNKKGKSKTTLPSGTQIAE